MDKAHFHSTTPRGDSPQQHGHWDKQAVSWRSDSPWNKGSQRQGLTWKAVFSLSPGSGSGSCWFNFVFLLLLVLKIPRPKNSVPELWGTATCLIALIKQNLGRKASSGSQFEGTVHCVGKAWSQEREDAHIISLVRRQER